MILNLSIEFNKPDVDVIYLIVVLVVSTFAESIKKVKQVLKYKIYVDHMSIVLTTCIF